MSETLRDKTLATQPPSVREQLLVAAASSGVTDPNDPGWFIVAAVFAAQASAQSAGEAAARVQASVQEIPSAIADGAAKASMDVKAVMEAAISGTVKASLDQAVQAGAATLRQAAADLPKIGRENQDRIVSEWKDALASAARRHTWAGFFQKLSVSVALAAALVGGVFIGGMFTGGKAMLYFASAKHRLTPSGWQLEVGQNGQPLCGPLAGRTVCLARRVTKPGT
ncbi:hypothetical protein A9R16_003420 [Acidiferrobacter thiooxydans]|uniref:hypothetical protein n=1 Tax=Acidiferrobacter thiooxydans TaxID=163359 RepID=UPI000826E72D|nr:hypothetical protein [Acidiferrobacter thiooxydans]UEO00464.1 hypothetical protein A9R16_003420 [Acidiferrobacter thiooxydans]